MTIRANDLETLHDFAFSAMARAAHNALEVRPIALAILGGIMWRAEPDSITIKYNEGKLANELMWTSITDKEYSCRYNDQSGSLEIRGQKNNGVPLYVFTAATSLKDVEQIFSAL